jgi:hypothetical protein
MKILGIEYRLQSLPHATNSGVRYGLIFLTLFVAFIPTSIPAIANRTKPYGEISHESID